jgi:colicin import membrane protein
VLALFRHNPRAMVLSLLLHLGVLILLLWAREQQVSYMDSAAPIQSPQPEESIPVLVEENRVAERLEEKRDQMAQQQQKVIGLKRKESAELQALREEAEKERLRLEKLKKQAEEEKRLAAEREKRLEEERKAAAERKQREQEQQKLAEEQRKKEEAEKKRLAEQKRKQEEAEKKRLAEEQRKKQEAERREQQLAQEAQAASTSGAAARQSGQAVSANQKRDGTGTGGTGRMSGGGGGQEYDKYIGMIRSKITRNWRRPPGTVSGLQVTLKVKLFPGGGVADVRIARSSGDPDYDRSAQEALQAADPLPVPSGKAFDRFRTLNLKFSPTGIQ